MVSTQNNSGERMTDAREHFLGNLLEKGGKCLGNECVAFQKKISSISLEE